ncbi:MULTISPECIES: hypothetical protein [unclassified Roseibium]|uniref:hypothetical protein n=1 Tax=unclassified Roseibium TaxID=2629323 RepID=UPI00273D17F6|nr:MULTISPECIES: hypothetical protein [unclassified Roseibium]
MSAHPEAFNFLRHRAYRFVQLNGKDREKLLRFCRSTLAEDGWQLSSRSGLSTSDIRALPNSVTDWVIKKYNLPRKNPKPNTSRETRAASVDMANGYREMLEELGIEPTVRNATFILGFSKSTVARHLRANGVSPKRDKKIENLPAKQRKLVRILDETFPKDGSALIKADDLGFALWDKVQLDVHVRKPEHPKSTLSTRRKRLNGYLDKIQTARLGYHFFVHGDVVAVSRGRRFKPVEEVRDWIKEEQKRIGFLTVRIPAIKEDYFWEDPWVQDILKLYKLVLDPGIYCPSELYPLMQVMHLKGQMLRDPEPIYNCALAALKHCTCVNQVPDLLVKFSDNIPDHETAGVVKHIGIVLGNFWQITGMADCSQQVLKDVEFLLRFEDTLKEEHPESFARLMYLKEIITSEEEDVDEFLLHCERCRELEKSGSWKAPGASELEKLTGAC